MTPENISKIVKIVHDIYDQLDSEDEEIAEEFAMRMGIYGKSEADEEIADRFMNFIEAAL